MVASLDGYIARKDNDVSWLESSDRYESGVVLSDEDITKFLENIDCYVMGSRTYEHALALGWPYGNVPCIVLTSRELASDRENVEFYSGDLTSLIRQRLTRKYRNIWIVGGSHLVRDIIKLDLADEIIISMMPVLIGEGIPFFADLRGEWPLHLKEVIAYRNGMVELCYEIRKK